MPQTATIEPEVDVMKMHHIIPPVNFKEEEELYDPTPEELEIIRQGEENQATGHYYVMRDDETVEEFFDRIESDPEKWMECNLNKEKFV